MNRRTPEDAPTDPDRMIRFGTIAGVDLPGARCTVELDDGVISPPLRWFETRSGKTRTWSPPSEGEQVMLLCPGGEIGAGVCLRGVISDANPAAGDSLTELVEFGDGGIVSYDPVGHALAIVLPAGGTMALIVPGGATLTGDLHCTGTITADGDVIAAGISGKNHKHGLVKAGTDTSGVPQ